MHWSDLIQNAGGFLTLATALTNLMTVIVNRRNTRNAASTTSPEHRAPNEAEQHEA
ncbi:hypothetical protein ACFZCP_44035 [Streptomyces sp. NPDC007971]|uniref:hypothetical protein n=1 Tax=Streptomyces sp. NPDC007971 TaxID=3364799 RepID=UPI0036EE13ED